MLVRLYIETRDLQMMLRVSLKPSPLPGETGHTVSLGLAGFISSQPECYDDDDVRMQWRMFRATKKLITAVIIYLKCS